MSEMLKKQRQELPFLFGQMLPQSCVDFLHLAIELPAADDAVPESNQPGDEQAQPLVHPAPRAGCTEGSHICIGRKLIHASALPATEFMIRSFALKK